VDTHLKNTCNAYGRQHPPIADAAFCAVVWPEHAPRRPPRRRRWWHEVERPRDYHIIPHFVFSGIQDHRTRRTAYFSRYNQWKA
jgi:hypothetical protein